MSYTYIDYDTLSDAYNVLEIPYLASVSTVRKAYKKLAVKYHSDQTGGDDKKIKKINEASSVIEQFYKSKQKPPVEGEQILPKNPEAGKAFADIMAKVSGGASSTIQRTTTHCETTTGHEGKNKDALKIPISLKDMYTGCLLSFDDYMFKIPRGISNGDLVEDNSKTVKAVIFAENGDNETYSRVGDDLYIEHTVTLKQALCAKHITIKNVDDKVIRLNNNSGVLKPMQKIVLNKMGFGTQGNLVIRVHVSFPEKIDEYTRQQLEILDI